MRKYLSVVLLPILIIAFFMFLVDAQASPSYAPDYSTASELIAVVNELRAERGLYAYAPNDLLMGIAQTHAEYLAAIQVSNTHIDAYGRRPFQRALDAGYAVAGDLSLGGFFSENVTGGAGLTAEGAVEQWMGDAPHQGTMLSEALNDVGAGVAVSGGTYYYVLDAGRSTGGTPVAYTPPPYVIYPQPTLATSTPNPDGAIIHVVIQGDTLLGIAIAYNVSLPELYFLNGLSETSVIYPDQEIIIYPAYTATPTQPTPTATPRPSSTPWPTSAQDITATMQSPSPAPDAAASFNSPGSALLIIIIAALIGAAILTFVGTKKKSG